jgi:hypothetical protein
MKKRMSFKLENYYERESEKPEKYGGKHMVFKCIPAKPF